MDSATDLDTLPRLIPFTVLCTALNASPRTAKAILQRFDVPLLEASPKKLAVLSTDYHRMLGAMRRPMAAA